jgi:hypothetical protein
MIKTNTTFAVVNTEVAEDRVRDLLTSAWEGGSNYWCEWDKVVIPEESKSLVAERKAKGDFYSFDYAFIPGVEIYLKDASGEADDSIPMPWILTREKMITGLQAMSVKYPHHFTNFIKEDDDAETGDVFLQMVLFGDIIFG